MKKTSSAADTQIGNVAELDAYIAAQRAGDGRPRDQLFKPMGRRAQAGAKRKQVVIERPPPPPKPTKWMVTKSVLRVLRGFGQYRFGLLMNRLSGRTTDHDTALLLRRVVERSGSTGPRIGKQLAMRIDMLPIEVSLQLAEIEDKQPPMDFEIAKRRVLEAVGRPMEEVYAVFDPEPIASDTIDCVYQAELISGERVAVRVRRNGTRARILADVRALALVTRLDELLGLVRPYFFEQLRVELTDFAEEEFDFIRQARQQTLFRALTKEAKLSWLSAPRVFHRFSNHAVLVSEFSSGVRLSEVLQAVEDNNEDMLLHLRGMRIDPERVARRVLHGTWWSLLENLFFNAQPEAYQIVVQPGDKLVFVGFQDCGTLGDAHKRLFRQVLRRLRDDDVSGATQAIVQLLSPLPYIDVFDFSKRIEAGLWYSLFALKDDEATWWERTMLSTWRTVLEVCRSYGVTPRLDVLRMVRATLITDVVAARLNPDLKLLKEFERYERRADRRAAKRFIQKLNETDLEDLEAQLVAGAARVSEGLMRAGLFLETAAENLPVSNLALSGKAAYAASQLLRLGVQLGMVFTFFASLTAVRQLGGEGAFSFRQVTSDTLHSPLFLFMACGLGALALRRILYRLEDKNDG